MKTQSAKVKAVAERTGGSAGGLVQWTVTATLQPSITNGYFKDEITLITNDSPPQMIPISVIALVQSAVSVTPSIINFGPIRAGQSVTKVVHVRSSAPVLDHQVWKATGPSSRPSSPPPVLSRAIRFT